MNTLRMRPSYKSVAPTTDWDPQETTRVEGPRSHVRVASAAMEEERTTTKPKRFGRYQILTELGSGGMADVYLGLSRGLGGPGKLVVLKRILREIADEPTVIDMFRAEARVALRLNHPNIVRTYAFTEEAGHQCLVMEYLEGQSMSAMQRAQPDGELPIDLGIQIVEGVLAGLHHAHELRDRMGRPINIVHRDVTPENVFVTYNGVVKVLDFGIAKAADTGIKTRHGVFKGKLRYSAPERFTGEIVDRRADIFSVGVILWQLLTKRRLWSGHTDLLILRELSCGTKITNPRLINPEVPRPLADLCMRALAHSPNDRFQTAAEFQKALEDFRTSEWPALPHRLESFMREAFESGGKEFQQRVATLVRSAEKGSPLSSTPPPHAVAAGAWPDPCDERTRIAARRSTHHTWASTLHWALVTFVLTLLCFAGAWAAAALITSPNVPDAGVMESPPRPPPPPLT